MATRRLRLGGRERLLRVLFCAVLLLVCGALRPADAAGRQSSTTGQQRSSSITADLSGGATFHFKIGPSLPDYTFKVIPDVREPDQYGNSQSTVLNIQVFRGNSRQPLQDLTGCDFSDMQPPPHGADWLRTDDFNFDGFQDVFLMTIWGATGNQSGCVWFFDPASGRFVYNKDLSALSRYQLEPETKTILTFERGGMAGMVYGTRQYKMESNRLLLVWSEDQDWDETKKQFHCVERERRGNRMAIVRDAWGGGETEEGEAPCNPSRLFHRPASQPSRRPH